jgi:hypothetical protein
MRIKELFMNSSNLFHRFVVPVLALAAGAILVVGSQSASAQGIIVTPPFSFSVDNQQYPAGTYRFTLVSPWLLSIQNADGKEKVFPIHPEGSRPPGSHGGLTFHKCEGYNELLAVYIPGTDMTAELIGQTASREESKTHVTQSSMSCLPGKVAFQGQIATGR